MEVIQDVQLDQERALYGKNDILVRNVSFTGETDGESAIKECSNVRVEHSFFNLRYPFWHVNNLEISDSEMTTNCRASLWYTHNAKIHNTLMHGIKALRECGNIEISDCDIISPEFGWSVDNCKMNNTTAESEYFMMRSSNLDFWNVKFKGKYSFQYIENAVFENCVFQTKDAFWHGKNIYVKDSFVKGEYLAWYSDGLTLENCTIEGTQPFCYCTNLKLINCKMIDTDLSFERSSVEARITTPIVSVKNPYSGFIEAPSIGEIIIDDDNAKANIVIGE